MSRAIVTFDHRHFLGRENTPHWVECVALHFLSNGVSNHKAQEARDGFCFDWVRLNLPAVRPPELANLHKKNMLRK